MRQLFLPACLCLIAWPGPTGSSDPRLSLDEFAGARAARAETVATLPAETVRQLDIPIPAIPTAATAATAIRAAALDIQPAADAPPAVAPVEPEPATEYPVPSGEIAIVLPEVAPLPKSRPPPRPVVHRSTEEICDTLVEAAQSNDLPAPYFIRLLFQESRFKPGAVSPAGALGIAQFMPETANGMGVRNPFDPLQAIPASAKLLRELLTQFGNLGLAAAAYNAGPKRIQDWLKSKGKLPEETQGYVKTITGRNAENWKAPETGSPAVKLPRHAPCQHVAGLLAWNGPKEIPVPQASPRRLAALAVAARASSDSKRKGETEAPAAPTEREAKPTQTAAAAPPTKPGKDSVQLAARERKHKGKAKPKKNGPLRLTQR